MPDAKPALQRAMSKQLLDVRKILKITLPSYPEVEVELYDGLLTGQIVELNTLDSDHEKGLKSLEFLIKSWSFVDAEDKPLPATVENLNKLPLADFLALSETVSESMTAEDVKKKKS